MDTYANMQAVGIEPPRMRGLDTDPAAAAAAAPLSSRGAAPLSSRGAAAAAGAGGAALRSSSSGLPPTATSSELAEGPFGAAGFDPFGLGPASGSPAGAADGAGRPAGGSAWSTQPDYSRPGGGAGGDEDWANDWRGDVRRSAAEGAALLGGAGAAGAPPRSDVRQSAEAYSPAQQASPGQGGGVSMAGARLKQQCWVATHLKVVSPACPLVQLLQTSRRETGFLPLLCGSHLPCCMRSLLQVQAPYMPSPYQPAPAAPPFAPGALCMLHTTQYTGGGDRSCQAPCWILWPASQPHFSVPQRNRRGGAWLRRRAVWAQGAAPRAADHQGLHQHRGRPEADLLPKGGGMLGRSSPVHVHCAQQVVL